MHVAVHTLTNRLVNIDVSPISTVGEVLKHASDLEHTTWRPWEYQQHKDVVIVHRRTFRRFCEMEQTMADCGICDGDPLELTLRFASERVATRFYEPVGFYEVSPPPASSGVEGRSADISVHLINVEVGKRPCVFLHTRHGGDDEEAVQCLQVWQPPNCLKLVPVAPLRPGTVYTVTLDLDLSAHGVRARYPDHDEVTCVAPGVDVVRTGVFAWHFQTSAAGGADEANYSTGMAIPAPGPRDVPLHDVMQMLLARPMDSCTKKQLVALKVDLKSMMDRVDVAITSIDEKIETISRRLRRKREQQAATDAAAAVEPSAPEAQHKPLRAKLAKAM